MIFQTNLRSLLIDNFDRYPPEPECEEDQTSEHGSAEAFQDSHGWYSLITRGQPSSSQSVGRKLTNKTDETEASRKYKRPATTTTSTLTTPTIMPRGSSAFCASLLPEADTGVRKGFNKRFFEHSSDCMSFVLDAHVCQFPDPTSSQESEVEFSSGGYCCSL